MSTAAPAKPLLALAVGDPAGVGPELAARMIADPAVRAAADLIVVTDARVLAQGADVAGVTLDLPVTTRREALGGGSVVFDLGHLDPATIQVGVAARAGGAFALENYRTALRLGADGAANGRQVGAVCFTPFNKAAMRMAHPPYDDEISYTQGVLGVNAPASEFNILDGLWNARVTSHVPLSAVAALITQTRVLRALKLTHASLLAAGIVAPRIGVAGLNPHAGDGGNFGHEDDGEIAPAVVEARTLGIDATGPFPPDTVFVRATKGQFDAVLTMYHDQGQIAMKLIGFDSGVTMLGGFPFAICTPAHGSAYDIAGKGVANPGATRAALLLAARAAAARMALPA